MSIPTYNTSVITAVGKSQQGLAFPKFIMGGKGGPGGTTYQLFKKSDTYSFAILRSEKKLVGRPFKINEIKFLLSVAMAANMSIVPVIRFDDENSFAVGATINSTNYPNSDKYIFLTPDNFSQALSGDKNFYLELQFTGSALVGVGFPISVEAELLETI